MKARRKFGRGRFLRLSALTAGGVVLVGCNLEGGQGPPGSEGGAEGDVDFSEIQASGQDQELEKLAEDWQPYDGEPVEISVWMYTPDEASLAAYKKAFEKKYSNIKLKYVVYPEANYVTKLNVALQAHNPPDVAIMEERAWMKAGLVVDLAPFYGAWGIRVEDFAPGGVGRFTLEDGPKQGIFGVGDFLAGNVMMFNKDLFEEAGADYPPVDRSLEWPEYAELCRQVARPDPDPTKAIYCGSVPDYGPCIYNGWLFGEDGRQVLGNMDSDAHIEAWNVGSALVRDKISPGEILDTVAEPDLFTQGGTAMVWTDFSFVRDFEAAGLDFGVVPSPVQSGSESFVETWTTAWGTFVESNHHHAALTFLEFMGTDAQRIRPEVSVDPPLSLRVAEEIGYGAGDQIKEEYLKVLEVGARPQVYVPPLAEGAWEPAEVYNDMTVQGKTEARPILEAEAKQTQPLVDQGWKDWDALERG